MRLLTIVAVLLLAGCAAQSPADLPECLPLMGTPSVNEDGEQVLAMDHHDLTRLKQVLEGMRNQTCRLVFPSERTS